MKLFRMSTLLFACSLFALVACQPVTSRPELPTAVTRVISSTVMPTTTVAQVPVSTPYTTANFRLPMNFMLGTELYVLDDYSDIFTFKHRQEEWELAFNLVTTAEVTDPVNPSGKLLPFPEDFISWIQTHPDFAAAAPTAVTVAGYPGVQIDVTPTWASSTAHKKPFLHLESIGWNLVTDPEKWRFIILDDVEGERMLILQITPPEDFERATELAQEVIKTMTIAPRADESPKAAAPAKFSPKSFKLPMNFDLGSPWRVTEDYPDVVTLSAEPNLVDIGFITVKGAQISGPADPFARVPFPQDFATWIESHGLFEVVASQPAMVGGFPGIQTDAIGTAACGHRKSWIFPSTGTGWNCTAGQYFRFSYFPDVYGEPLLILSTGARTDDGAAEEFKQGIEGAQGVLDTVVFAEP